MRKQLDPRIPTLINNNVIKNHRSFIVLVGDKGRDQIVNLHYLLSQARVSARPSVLWCYKKELGFTSHRKKREARIKRDVKRGIREPNEQNPFEIFVTVTDIRYTYYKESHKILGNTFGMCVLQDFEAVTPNLLARTIETVEGGGLVILLLKTMSSLKQLYTMTMDVHARYRTTAHDSVTARFNERFILSLGSCDDCLVLDDELNVLPISRGKDIAPLPSASSSSSSSPTDKELSDLKSSLEETKPSGPLVQQCKTLDQARAVLTFIDAISEKTLSSTVSLTAGRGRGKSAALGLSIAAALVYGYSNVFVTSPSPENLKTVFEFVFKGLDGLGYEEHLDYDIVQSTNPEFKGAIVRVNIFREHRQTIQYIQPEDAHVLGQAELVVIDEAAAIPLPLVQNLLGPYLVFMSSTINGYEGTGRSLSLKLIQQLRESTRPSHTKDISAIRNASSDPPSKSKKPLIQNPIKTRTLREIKLETPIRYSSGDKIERWLNSLLCLDATTTTTSKSNLSGCPHPSQCELYYVSRDTLFSYHPASEVFLQRIMALFVSSHYKNQPNDLQLLSDAPAHHLFVLLPPLKEDNHTGKDEGTGASDGTVLPEPLVVIQVALEGGISRGTILDGLVRGERKGGDMIPWILCQQFQEPSFGMLSGARVVRVACHPDYVDMGYGSRAMQSLNSYYSGEYLSVDESAREDQEVYPSPGEIDPSETLLSSHPKIRPASSLPPLLLRLAERKPEPLDYLGVSYGLTSQLLRFWKRLGYVPLYLRQTKNELTGENTCVMARGLGSVGSESEEGGWLKEFAGDFRRRFDELLGFGFREFGSVLALSVVDAVQACSVKSKGELQPQELSMLFTPFDLKRLEQYGNNASDYHVILDLVPNVAKLYFEKRLGVSTSGEEMKLSPVQSAILLAIGLQRKSVDDVENELQLPVSQILALFVKVIKKVSNRLTEIRKAAIRAEIDEPRGGDIAETGSGLGLRKGVNETGDSQNTNDLGVGVSISATLADELDEAGDEVTRALREKQKEMIGALDLGKYAIDRIGADWSGAEAQIKASGNRRSTVVSVKMGQGQSQKLKRKAGEAQDDEEEGKKQKKSRRSKNLKRG